jgi:hypothetical protein
MATTTANPATDLFSRLSFRRAVSPSALRLTSPSPRTPRLSAAIVAVHKRNPKRLKYDSQRQFTVRPPHPLSSRTLPPSNSGANQRLFLRRLGCRRARREGMAGCCG